MAERGHFHFGSGYNLAQPSQPVQWTCNDAPGIDCASLARAHEIRTKIRNGQEITYEERQFLYDLQLQAIKQKQRDLGMIK
jgi:hypothetical protein